MNTTCKFEEFIVKYGAGEEELENRLRRALTAFEKTTLSSCVEKPAPGYAALFRTWRGAAALTDDGRLLSTELFHIADWRLFDESEDERLANLQEVKWTGTGTFITQDMPEKMTRQVSTLLDYDGEAIEGTLEDQVRRAETFIARNLISHEAESYLLSFPPPDPKVPFRGAPRLSAGPRKILLDIISSYLRPDYVTAISEFRGRLNLEQTDIMRMVRVNSVDGYNWLGGWDYGKKDDTQGLHRRQAAMAFPLFWSLVKKPIGHVREAVDGAQPLIPALASQVQAPESSVKILRGATPSDFDLVAPPTDSELADFISPLLLLPQGVPTPKAGEWKAFREAAMLAENIGRHARDPDVAHSLLRGTGGKWGELNVDDLTMANISLRDMLLDLHSNIFVPATKLSGLNSWRYHHTMQVLTGGRTISQIAEATRLWSEKHIEIHDMLEGAYPPEGVRGESEWLPMMTKNRFVASNGLVVEFLTNESELIAEGRSMSHCVGGYAPMCLYHGVHIASIRTRGGERVATVEFRGDNFLGHYLQHGLIATVPLRTMPQGVVQLRGFKNSEPGDEARQALWDFTQAVAAGSVKIDVEALEASYEFRQSDRVNQGSSMCYDYTAPDAIETAWRLYGELMPKNVFRRGPFRVIGGVLEKEEEKMRERPREDGDEPGERPSP